MLCVPYKGNLAKAGCEVIRSDSARGYLHLGGIGLKQWSIRREAPGQVLKIQGKPPTI